MGGWVGLRWIGDNIMERSMHLKSDGNKDLAGGKDNVERSIEMRFCRRPNIEEVSIHENANTFVVILRGCWAQDTVGGHRRRKNKHLPRQVTALCTPNVHHS